MTGQISHKDIMQPGLPGDFHVSAKRRGLTVDDSDAHAVIPQDAVVSFRCRPAGNEGDGAENTPPKSPSGSFMVPFAAAFRSTTLAPPSSRQTRRLLVPQSADINTGAFMCIPRGSMSDI